jgi:hypothetical protein
LGGGNSARRAIRFIVTERAKMPHFHQAIDRPAILSVLPAPAWLAADNNPGKA